ncbi:tripartite tricarboxylate transporter substrate binding protein [Reyranella sp. CPCC 100927]|uniref:Bug family tripartite tricarboxylate transporter substrate binding protein n=1 Tax=Reyranella sp. CPCC 100927 TaxID=2599616 RepID=UPI0011B3CABC|nr:tripartite tricarboxylate transporter substrate binding protein [Reyranella sp. CPCC 100927]TWS95817.1 tripartite tricarboxylate transporter substrate binding protein [Reyranella sp. CPCC 100927]
MLTRRTALLGTAALSALPTAARAQAAWAPSKPMRLVVPFAAGSATDIVSRALAAKLQAAWNQPVVVDNKPGAGGMLAASDVARAAPDGHTLLVATNTTHAANPWLIKNLSYDPVKDFEAVTTVVLGANIVLVHPDLPVKSIAELTAYAKANPGKLNFSEGSSSQRMSAELYKQLTGVNIVHVPYKSSPPAMQDLIAGTVQLMFSDPQNALPQIKAGKVRALAVTSRERTKAAPDLPTMIEAGVPGYELTWWQAIYAPAKTPAPVVEAIYAKLREITADAATRDLMTAGAADVVLMSPQEFAAFTKSEIERWRKTIQAAGIQPE